MAEPKVKQRPDSEFSGAEPLEEETEDSLRSKVTSWLGEWRKAVGPNGESALWAEYEKKMKKLTPGFSPPAEIREVFEGRLQKFDPTSIRVVSSIGGEKAAEYKQRIDRRSGKVEDRIAMGSDYFSSPEMMKLSFKHEFTHYLSQGTPVYGFEYQGDSAPESITHIVEEGAASYLAESPGSQNEMYSSFVVSFLKEHPKLAADFWRYYLNLQVDNVDFYIEMCRSVQNVGMTDIDGNPIPLSRVNLENFLSPFTKNCKDAKKREKLRRFLSGELGIAMD